VLVPIENILMRGGIEQWRERIVCGLLFLFPIFGISLAHWFSGIYTLIFLISLTILYRPLQTQLFPEERLLLYFIAIYFLTYILSSLINDWSEQQTRYLGVEIRYLAIIPIYLMLRNYWQSGRWLLWGCMAAAIVVAVQAYFDVYVVNLSRATGIYSPNLIGPFAAMIAAWLLIQWKFQCEKRWLLLPLFVGALFAVALSGSRGAYLGLVVMMLLIIIMSLASWQRYVAVAVVIIGLIGTYTMVEVVKERVDVAIDETSTYFESGKEADSTQKITSTSTRLEMWRFSGMAFWDSPVFGVGRGNYTEVAHEYARAGKIRADVAESAHPHNAYAEALFSRGTVGLIAFLLMILYPLYYFISTRQQATYTALLGTVHIVGLMVFSLTDASTFIKGNFASIFLLYLAVFFAWHVRCVREVEQIKLKSNCSTHP